VIRFTGGLLYLSGMILMAINLYMTARDSETVTARIPAVAGSHA